MDHDHKQREHALPKFPDYDPAQERLRAEQAATARRLDREEEFVRTRPVAGHDFKREHEERERER